MYHSTLNHTLNPLFDLCRQVYPYLDGKLDTSFLPSALKTEKQSPKKWLVGQQQDHITIQAITDDIKIQSPDAGQAYYMTRTWDLLCWQPMYIAFIAIYGLKQVPDFTTFKQQRQYQSVAGFVFQSAAITKGEAEQLIPIACAQLKPLFEHYRKQLDSLQRCRPGYVRRLMADLVLANLLKVSEHIKDITREELQSHALLWFSALELPKNLIKTLVIKQNQPITHIRTSCCLTYKANNELCANCPKKHK